MSILFKTIPGNREFKTYEHTYYKRQYSCLTATYSCLLQPNNDSYLKY
jgi:hypothetical protein